ncbi:MAG: hypothetical protein TU35_009450 [Thermoproteus sp. AZ2]|uniref:Uncharacterized protein n=1 Tax=Thermoproteus sp. AZ2 TaxID=1609232 RepID=A0ACC6V3A2_9CREN
MEALVERKKELADCEIEDWDKFAALPLDVQQKVLEILGGAEVDDATRLLLSLLERKGVVRCL